MKVLLINPPGSSQFGYFNPPIGLGYLASSVRQAGGQVRLVDGVLTGEDYVLEAIASEEWDTIGVTILTLGRHKALRIAALAKAIRPHSRIVLGGAHASTNTDQLKSYPFVDDVCRGDGERWIVDKEGAYDNLDDIAFPAWDLFDLKRYPRFRWYSKPIIPLVFSRGCPASCTFCSAFWVAGVGTKRYRVRSPLNMVEEIRMLNKDYGMTVFGFSDDAMTVDRDATLGLCEQILSLDMKIKFQLTTRTDCVDPEMLKALKKAGCYQISYGIESGSEKILASIHKGHNAKEYKEGAARAIRWTKEAGIKVNSLVMIGNPKEDDSSIEETRDFLRATRPDRIGCVGGVWILPGTALYQHSKRLGIINDDFWFTQTPVMTYTHEASLEQLAKWQDRVYSFSPYRLFRHRTRKALEKLLRRRIWAR